MRTTTTLLDALHQPDNHEAWRRLLRGYTPMLRAYARRLGFSESDVNEVVGDTLATFVRLYREGRYDRSQARLKSWLGGIARNSAHAVRRKRVPASVDNSVLDLRPGDIESGGELDAEFERAWRLRRLDQSLERLRHEIEPEAYQAFDLYAIKNVPPARVAALLNITANKVYIIKSRALARLREIVAESAQEDEA